MIGGQSISSHLKDLGKRDITVAYDCIEWLTPKQREIDRKSRPKRIANRYIAACMIVAAAENPSFCKEVLDRTEGKVADKLITVDYNDLVKQLEAARQRVLANQHPQRISGDQEIDRLHMSSYQTHGILTPAAEDLQPERVLEESPETQVGCGMPATTITGPITGSVDTSHPIDTRDKETERCRMSTEDDILEID